MWNVLGRLGHRGDRDLADWPTCAQPSLSPPNPLGHKAMRLVDSRGGVGGPPNPPGISIARRRCQTRTPLPIPRSLTVHEPLRLHPFGRCCTTRT